MPHPEISVVIPAYNSEKTIKACLDSVFLQETDLKYEVIVADSSLDDTPGIIKSQFPQARLIHSEKRMSCGEARNVGIKSSKADIIISLDSDCVVPSKSWMNEIFESHKKYDVVSCRIINGNPKSLFGWSLFLMEFCNWLTNEDKVVKLLLGYNVSYKRAIFEKYGYFPKLNFGDELMFHSKIRESLFFKGTTVVKHINRTGMWDILNHSFEMGVGGGIARARCRDLQGSFLVQYPFLIFLIPFYRLFLTGYRSAQAGYFLNFLLVSPLVFINAIYYTAGFLTAVFKKT